jgi:hypothetical protein
MPPARLATKDWESRVDEQEGTQNVMNKTDFQHATCLSTRNFPSLVLGVIKTSETLWFPLECQVYSMYVNEYVYISQHITAMWALKVPKSREAATL